MQKSNDNPALSGTHSPTKTFRNKRIVILILLALITIAAGWFSRVTVRDQLKENLHAQLEYGLNSVGKMIQIWMVEKKVDTELVASDQTVRQKTLALLEKSERSDKSSEVVLHSTLLHSDELRQLRDLLRPVCKKYDYVGFVVFDQTGLQIGALLDEPVGRKDIIQRSDFVQKSLKGETLWSLPFSAEIKLPVKEGENYTANMPTMFISAPILNDTGDVKAVLAFRVRPESTFSQIFESHRTGKTGESYAFDNEGIMLTDSRFKDQLIKLGLLSDSQESHAILNIEIRNPGGNLLEGFHPPLAREKQPLTRMAASATQGESGVDLEGYNDYRGVPVVGAWTWLPDPGFGLATEIDVEEAYGPLHRLEQVYLALSGLLVLLAGTTYIAWTRHQKAEQRAGGSESFLQAVVQSMADAVLTIDSNGLINSFNLAAERTFGYSPSEVIGKNVNMLMPEPYHSEHDDYVGRYLQTGEARVIGIGREVVGQRKDGSVFPMALSVTEMAIEGKRQFVGICKDITDHKKAEEIYSRFGRILEDSFNEIFLFETDTLKFTQVNRGARQNLGYTIDELRSLTPVDIKPEFTREQFEAMIQPLRDGTKPHLLFETIHQRKNGTDYPAEIHLQLSKQETPPQFLAIIQDITERKNAEKAIRIRENQYQRLHSQMQSIFEGTATSTGIDFLSTLVSSLASALKTRYAFIGILTGQGTIKTLAVWANDDFVENFEYSVTDTPCEKVTEKKMHFYPENIQKIFPDDKLLADLEVESYMGSPLADSSKKVIGLLAVMHDKPMVNPVNFEEILKIYASRTETEIERQRIEKQLENTYKQLVHSEKLAEAGKLSASFAHEFNNPLGCVRSALEQVGEGVPMPEEYQELINVAVKESNRMAGLIQNLMGFYKPSLGTRQTLNIHQLIDEVVLLIGNSLKQDGIEVEKRYSADLPKITIIPDQIKQVILNLVQNAQEAISENGGRIILATVAREGTLEISIQDTGSGIAPDILDSIFEPFVTTKGPNQGTGLGLSVSYGIVKAHGGDIRVHSVPDSGTTFTILLPAGDKNQ